MLSDLLTKVKLRFCHNWLKQGEVVLTIPKSGTFSFIGVPHEIKGNAVFVLCFEFKGID